MRALLGICFVAAVVLLLVAVVTAQPPTRTPRKVALLVGPKEYMHDYKTLPHLDDDVNALAAELRKAGFDEVVVLTDAPEGKNPATKTNILKQLERLLSGDGDAKKAIRKDDVVLLALSGHGQEFFVDRMTKNTYFAPTDGKRKDPKTLVDMTEVLEKLEGSGARNLILADMCREIYDPNKGKGLSTDNLKLPKNSAILFGCESTQESFVNTELKHSLFTYAVLEVLRESNAEGKGLLWSQLVSGVELKFASDEYKKLMGPDKQQSPVERKTDLKATLVRAANVQKEPKAGEEREFEIAKGVKMRFCWIPPGKAMLGSPKEEKGRYNKSEDEHEFTTKGFWLGKYEVTQSEYEALVGANPSWFSKNGDGKETVARMDTGRFPVEMVSWEDCQGFLKKCTMKGLRLPHVDEWEYAARGDKGNRQPFYWGDSLNGVQANCDGNYPYGTTKKGPYLERTAAVGSYEKVVPHPWGLCDMVGNVHEWCDNWRSREQKARVLRGGNWSLNPEVCRVACPSSSGPDSRFNSYGFRVCFRMD